MVDFQFIVNKIFYLNFSCDKAIEINPNNDVIIGITKEIAFYALNKYEEALKWLTFSLQLIKFFI